MAEVAAASMEEYGVPDLRDPPVLAVEVEVAEEVAAARDGTRAELVRCVALVRYAAPARFVPLHKSCA